MFKLKIQLEESVADEIFCLLQEIIDYSKEKKDITIIKYVAPILIVYGEALIEAKPGKKRQQPLLDLKRMRKYQ